MRTLKMLGGALLVAALLVTHLIRSSPYRQFQYGDTWVRVWLITGKTQVLVQGAGSR